MQQHGKIMSGVETKYAGVPQVIYKIAIATKPMKPIQGSYAFSKKLFPGFP